MNKKRIAILFGGRSAEHQISLISAYNVVHSIDEEQYFPLIIGITKEGKWMYQGQKILLQNENDPKHVTLKNEGEEVIITYTGNQSKLINLKNGEVISHVDVIYPVMHGTYGEDGSIQGLAKLANLPCVGCGIIGSAMGMDKDVMKKILRDGGIGVADFFTLRKDSDSNPTYKEIVDRLGNELFIKPANLGSSVGVAFVSNEEEYNKALEEGFSYDRKVIVEEKISGREIEVAVMGNDRPLATYPGEILPKSSWYSFENKYVDEDGAALAIPAELDENTTDVIRQAAIDTYLLLELCGMTRVDFFLKDNGDLIVNEVNTLPGFTSVSMYPKLWEHSGVPQKSLITKLIEYAEERFADELALKHI